MDITAFVVSGRNKALLYGDHGTYHSQASRGILRCRQKLSITSKNRSKFSQKPAITAEDVQRDVGYLHLLLLTSERAWAQAMSFKAAHAANSKGTTGRTRKHIVSRLVKACHTADLMVSVVSQMPDSGATPTDVLEARAYAALLTGAAAFEKQAWDSCLRAYSVARVIYSALSSSVKGDMFKDLLSDTIDPSIRYAAYQLKTPRTVPIPVIARERLMATDPELAGQINQLDPTILADAQPDSGSDAQGAPRTLSWRSREVTIEDAAIAQAWSSVATAKTQLAKTFAAISHAAPRRLAAAYDDILTATQEAVDATKLAIDELREEGVSPSDPRMQSLQITRTAVNFEMISWRIGRNRVLTGTHDGALEESNASRKAKKKPSSEGNDDSADVKSREEKPRDKLVRLKEKVALYDGTLHNLDAVKELAGVAADEDLSQSLEATRGYFEALKCLAIGRSHAVIGRPSNALALLNHASILLDRVLPPLAKASSVSEGPLNIHVSTESAEFLQSVLRGELQRHRALVHIKTLEEASREQALLRAGFRDPLCDRLGEFPEGGVDLSNIVELPPTLSSIPVKPIFLDVAWNHIEYPSPDGDKSRAASSAPGSKEKQADQAPQKRGWFGFGR